MQKKHKTGNFQVTAFRPYSQLWDYFHPFMYSSITLLCQILLMIRKYRLLPLNSYRIGLPATHNRGSATPLPPTDNLKRYYAIGVPEEYTTMGWVRPYRPDPKNLMRSEMKSAHIGVMLRPSVAANKYWFFC